MANLDDIVAETQSVLKPLFHKPKLTPKLLKKPPFRFLHDIFNAVRTAVRFPEGLYEDSFLNSSNIKDKEKKMAFLQTLIDFVAASTSTTLQARPSKIVAGLEPDLTNILLQEFGKLAMAVKQGHENSETILARYRGESVEPESKPEPEPAPEPEKPALEPEKPTLEPEKPALEPEKPDPKPIIHAPPEKEQEPIAARKEPPQRESRTERRSPQEERVPSQPSMGFVQLTQHKLRALISKPKLSDNLLNRPPFRFLHDIVKELNRCHGNYFASVFSEKELTAKLQDTTEKLAFVEKLIRFASSACGRPLSVNAKKVLAGMEPEHTNEMLQELANAVSNGRTANELMSSHAAEDVVTADVVLPAEAPQARPQAASGTRRSRDSEAVTDAADVITAARPPKPSADIVPVQTDVVPAEPVAVIVQPKPHESAAVTSTAPAPSASKRPPAARVPQPSKPIPSQVPSANAGRRERPKTARRAPPKVKTNIVDESGLPGASAPNAAATAAGDAQSAPSVRGLIAEDDASDDNDEDDMGDDVEGGEDGERQHSAEPVGDVRQHGKLVRDILEQEKKSASNAVNAPGNVAQKQKEAKGITMRRIGHGVGKERKGFYSQQQIEDVRESIQKLCQSVNPLGKCVDFVHEDLALMSQGLAKWRHEYERQEKRLQDAQRETEENLQPLRTRLHCIEGDIRDRHRQVQQVRASMFRNEQRLREMLERHAKRL